MAELNIRPVAGIGWAPAPATMAIAPAAASLAPAVGLLAAPSAPIAAFPALAAAAAAPELPASAAAPVVEAAPAPLAPERVASAPLARAREKARSAGLTARALAFLLFSLPAPKASSVESYLRENQDYVLAEKRGTLADGAVVESEHLSPTRVTLSHPGLKPLFDLADAIKANGGNEDDKLSALRAAVADASSNRRGLQLRALELRRAQKRRAFELGDYFGRGGGETEAALLANLALTRAGFKPKLVRVSAWRRDARGRVIGEERTLNLIHTARGQILFDTVSTEFDGKKLQDATVPAGTAGRESGIVAELAGPRVFTPSGKPKTSAITATATGEKAVTFEVVGRSAADRLFKEDEKQYQAAPEKEPVTVEWMFFPFYVDGHTALRIGDKLYEFTRRGWRASPARAFLFNNPFFEAQMARHPKMEMPPFSFGVPLSVAKADAERFAALAAEGRGIFSFWFNNCNQVPYRFLRKAGLTLGDGVFASFSSIRAFRLLLLNPPEQAGAPRIYPLPNQANASEPLGPAVPRGLVNSRSVLVDFALFVWNWPKFVFEKLPLPRRK